MAAMTPPPKGWVPNLPPEDQPGLAALYAKSTAPPSPFVQPLPPQPPVALWAPPVPTYQGSSALQGPPLVVWTPPSGTVPFVLGTQGPPLALWAPPVPIAQARASSPDANGPVSLGTRASTVNQPSVSSTISSASVRGMLASNAHGTSNQSLPQNQLPHIDYSRYDITIRYMFDQMKTNARSGIVQHIRFDNAAAGLAVGPGLEALLLWARQVYAGGPWDQKPILDRMLKLKKTPPHGDYYFPVRGDVKHEYYYDIWANIHFGYVGSAAGFDPWTLKTGANIPLPFVGRSDKGDDLSVQIGIDLWKRYKLNLTIQELHDAILAHKLQFASAEYAYKAIPGVNWR